MAPRPRQLHQPPDDLQVLLCADGPLLSPWRRAARHLRRNPLWRHSDDSETGHCPLRHFDQAKRQRRLTADCVAPDLPCLDFSARRDPLPATRIRSLIELMQFNGDSGMQHCCLPKQHPYAQCGAVRSQQVRRRYARITRSTHERNSGFHYRSCLGGFHALATSWSRGYGQG